MVVPPSLGHLESCTETLHSRARESARQGFGLAYLICTVADVWAHRTSAHRIVSASSRIFATDQASNDDRSIPCATSCSSRPSRRGQGIIQDTRGSHPASSKRTHLALLYGKRLVSEFEDVRASAEVAVGSACGFGKWLIQSAGVRVQVADTGFLSADLYSSDLRVDGLLA
jgi:hypothetical protein